MTEPTLAQLKTAITNRLGDVAGEHRLGHQDAYANRYSMRSDNDAPVELMFEKAPDTEPHLWVLAAQVSTIPEGAVHAEFYSKADLYKLPAKNGGMQYGRHSALEKMALLGKADLMRFTLRSVADLDLILLVVKRAQRGGRANG